MSKLTKVQQDVIDRLRDGWRLRYDGDGWMEERFQRPSRHVATRTVEALYRRGLIQPQSPVKPYWGLTDAGHAA